MLTMITEIPIENKVDLCLDLYQNNVNYLQDPIYYDLDYFTKYLGDHDNHHCDALWKNTAWTAKSVSEVRLALIVFMLVGDVRSGRRGRRSGERPKFHEGYPRDVERSRGLRAGERAGCGWV